MTSIVVGVDGSPQSKAALKWAVEEARHVDGTVTAVYVYGPPAEEDPFLGHSHFPSAGTAQHAGERSQEWHDEQLGAAQRHAEGAVNKWISEVVDEADRSRVKSVAVPGGRPSHRLVEWSRDAELLVVGARGRGGFRDLRLGSVSQQCVRHAHCPVAIIRE